MELFCKSAIYKLFTGAPKSARMGLRARCGYTCGNYMDNAIMRRRAVRYWEPVYGRDIVLYRLHTDVATAWATQVCVDALRVAKNR